MITRLRLTLFSSAARGDLKWSDAADQLLFFVAPFYILLLYVVIFKNLIPHEDYINSFES